MSTEKTLIVITGPTASGKTDLSIRLAQHFDTQIISADSRQFYREMTIGTAVPTQEELKLVKHYFIQHISIHDYYNVYKYEMDALLVINEAFKEKNTLIVCGGSGLYIDALCYGIDDLPDPDPVLRNTLHKDITEGRYEELLKQLQTLDPEYYNFVDKNNTQRVLRALEVCILTGKTYSSQRKQQAKKRNFNIVKYCIDIPREILYQRINQRTDQMMEKGWLEEAKTLHPFRETNALNTVGYKELFLYFDGKCTLDQSITDIKTHTRRYAKRQVTWFKRDHSYQWLSSDEILKKHI